MADRASPLNRSAAELHRRLWIGAVIGLVTLRLGMWWLMMHNVPRVPDHYGWYFHHGGDQALYVSVAQDIVAGRPGPTTVGAGLPLVFAGLLWLTGAVDYDGILPLIVIGNGALLGLLSVAVMAALARALTGSRIQALCAAAAWTLLPYVLWIGFIVHPEADLLRNAYVPRQLWMTGITDGPSLLLVLLGTLLVALGARGVRRQRWRRLGLLALGGACMGFAVAIRIHVLPVAMVSVLALSWSRRWGEVVAVALGLLAGFGPQFWYNATTTGHPLNIPYLSGWLYFWPDGRVAFNYKGTPFAPQYLVDNFVLLARRLPWLTLAALVAAAGGAVAFVRCWQARGSLAAMILFGAPVASFALHIVTFVYAADPVRFTLPALSMGLPALTWTAFTAVELFGGLRHRISSRQPISQV